MENSSRQSGALDGLRNNLMLSLPGVIGDIDGNGVCSSRRHHENLSGDFLVAEPERVDRLFTPRGRDGFGRDVSKRLAWTDGSAHGALADRSTVVTHIALHHLLVFRNQLGDS